MSNCKHKFGKIEEGYQYCKICNKAEPIECNHQYEIIDEQHHMIGSIFSSRIEISYICRCVYCGDIKTVVF
jgi:hypothetical protein